MSKLKATVAICFNPNILTIIIIIEVHLNFGTKHYFYLLPT